MYIAIEGADGSGKSTVAVATYQKLLECSNQRDHIEIVSHNTFHLSSSYLARIIGHKTTKVISYGEQKGSRVLTFAGYLLSLFPYLLAKREGKRKGIVISDRSPWITGQIYVPKVSQTAAKVIIPFAKRIMERPDYIVHLQVDSEVAWERVREKGSGQLYRSREDLDELVTRYDAFMKDLNDSDVRVFSIATKNKTIDEVCREATTFVDNELKSRELSFIQEIKCIDDDVQTVQYANAFERVKDAVSVASLKKRLAQWYGEGKIDEFDGADVLDSLNKSKVQYILGNLALVFGSSTLAPPGSFIVFSPARFLYTIGSRIYLEVKRDKTRAKIHGLDVAIFGAIPIFGRLNYLIPLYRENPNLYRLVKEQMTEHILGSNLTRKKG